MQAPASWANNRGQRSDYINPNYKDPNEDDMWCFQNEEETEDMRAVSVGAGRRMPLKPAQLRPRDILRHLAVLVMMLLMVIPVWNSIGLINDEVFTYINGTTSTVSMLISCIALFCVSYFTLRLFLERIRPDLRTERTLLMVSGIFLSSLGILLILCGGPIARSSMQASKEFMYDCRFGEDTKPLFVAYEELKALRLSPECSHLDSVELCDGFDLFPMQKEAKVIKAMENRYLCSGLCQGLNQTTGDQIYPPSLFGSGTHKLTCEGMASRRMVNFCAEVAGQMVAEGCMLVGAAIFISFGQLFQFCTKPASPNDGAHEWKKLAEEEEKGYGATH
jgi:hypothetical protein